jgi:FAD/FMN-containing dehydrogenase
MDNQVMPPTIPTTPVTPAIVEKLRAIVGDRGLLEQPSDIKPFVTDWRGQLAGNAALVVRPASTEEVAAVVKLCHDHDIAIVPQGGNTGLMGGATPWPAHTGILLSLGRMNRVIEFDTKSSTMTVEAGCVLQTLQQLAADNDRLLPLSLGAQGSCMIGGNLSTNAGGAQVLHYGNTRSFVLGLEVVLPNGDVWNRLRALKKDNTGYDLKHLFIGAEGTLGIITKAVIKVWPKPKDVATAWLALPSVQAAVDLLGDSHAASGDTVTSFEIMHRLGLNGVFQYVQGTQDPLPHTKDRESPWYVLTEWSSARPKQDGAEGMAERMEAFLADAMERGLVEDAVIAQSEAQARAMWAIREGHAEASRSEGPAISYDMSVATSKIPDFVARGEAAAKSVLPGIRLSPVGHIGDGNLHYGFKAPEGMTREQFTQYKPAITRAINDLIRDFGGSISAEHGIGQEKLDELAHYSSPVEMAAMRAIKLALDPKNIMNPGKIVRMMG